MTGVSSMKGTAGRNTRDTHSQSLQLLHHEITTCRRSWRTILKKNPMPKQEGGITRRKGLRLAGRDVVRASWYCRDACQAAELCSQAGAALALLNSQQPGFCVSPSAHSCSSRPHGLCLLAPHPHQLQGDFTPLPQTPEHPVFPSVGPSHVSQPSWKHS